MPSKTVKTYCRYCHANCPMEIEVEDNKLISLKPDIDNEIFGGYTCLKGRQMPEQLYLPERILTSLKKNDDGSHTDVGSVQALDEIAEKLKAIKEKYGARAIASYNGTVSFQNSATHPVAKAWHVALDSPSYYTSITIDQPAKVGIGQARMGFWAAGQHTWQDSNVALIIGNNTDNDSLYSGTSFLLIIKDTTHNPTRFTLNLVKYPSSILNACVVEVM